MVGRQHRYLQQSVNVESSDLRKGVRWSTQEDGTGRRPCGQLWRTCGRVSSTSVQSAGTRGQHSWSARGLSWFTWLPEVIQLGWGHRIHGVNKLQ